MPEYMCGVINLRGSVVPVIDLRLKFGLKAVERTINTSIVVMEIEMGEDTVILGALTDSVKEVIDFEAGDIEPAPRIGTKLETDFIKGMGKKNDSFIIILDIDKVFSAEELIKVRGMEIDKIGEG
jgi:purine-binding chemotaxis protein CheW